jgi:hypothetical protein
MGFNLAFKGLKYIAYGKEVPVYWGVSEWREKLNCGVLVNSGLYM